MKSFSLFVLISVSLYSGECSIFNFFKWNNTPAKCEYVKWPENEYPRECPRQSPVDVITANASKKYLKKLCVKFPLDSDEQTIYVENTGYYLEIFISHEVEEKKRPYVTGGPLFKQKYIFEQLHFHWGPTDECGSENYLNGKCFPTEVHIVFYNQIYRSLEEAVRHPDGVAVIGIFGERPRDDADNAELERFISKIPEITQPGNKTTTSFKIEFFFIKKSLKQNEYYTFPGSLTTPPYQECVTWIICPKPFSISSRQVSEFRKLIATNGSQLTDNVRPLQNFNNRPFIKPEL